MENIEDFLKRRYLYTAKNGIPARVPVTLSHEVV